MKTIMGFSGDHHMPADAAAPRKSIFLARDPFPPAHRPDPSYHAGKSSLPARATVVRKIRAAPVDTEFLAWLAELL